MDKTTYSADNFDTLDEPTEQSIAGVILVTFTVVEGSLIPFVDYNSDFAAQCIPESSKLTQVCTQDDDVALRRIATLSTKT